MTTERAIEQPFGRPGPLDRAAHFARGIWSFSRRHPLGAVGAFVILVVAFLAATAEIIAPYDFSEPVPLDRLQGPSTAHFFGTDDLGRDTFSRVLFGARLSLIVGIGAVAAGIIHGALWGLASGYIGGWFDAFVQRIMEAIMSVPLLLMALVVVVVWGAGIEKIILALGLVLTPIGARVMRAEVLSAKENMYIEAARAIGASGPRIAFRHILPNVTAPILVLVTVNLGFAIIAEAMLSFLGLGPNLPSWGEMLAGEGRQYMIVAPWIALFPGLAITTTVLAFNLLGDAIRDEFDPRLRDGR